MIRWRRVFPTPRRALSWAKYAAIGFVTTQLSVAAGLTIVDEVRKRRSPGGDGGFPALPPQQVTVGSNALTTYTEGRSLYRDMLEAIENAREYIFFETFIWKSDRVGQRFKSALIRAAHRGVQVYCIYDGFANIVVDPRFKIFPRHRNLHVLKVPEIRMGLFLLDLRRTGRDHRKMLIVDGNVGFVGGYNIGYLYASEWRDTHVRIVGDAVWELENGFVDFWNHFKSRHQPALDDRGARQWNASITAAMNDPSRMLYPVRGIYLDALERATDTVLMTSAYFIPDREILRALKAAARRGVTIRILVPENSNHVVADWVSSTFFEVLLREGIEIWLYEHAMIHAKTATVDGHWSTVGTANIDRLSMFGNFEVNMQFMSTEFAQVMRTIFDNDLTTARRLELDQWVRRPLIQRAVEHLLKPLAPLL